jgi:hypothetical protein
LRRFFLKKAVEGERTRPFPLFSGLWKVKIQKRPSGTFLTNEYAQRDPTETKRRTETLGNWSLTLPLPVVPVPSTGSPTPLAAFSCTIYVARLDFTGCVPFPFFLSGFGVDTLDFACVVAFHWGVSPSADGDKGCSPLTSAAFSRNCCTKKLLYF